MLSNDDYSGTVTFLLGIVIVVMAGVGLTIIIDSRTGQSSQSISIKEDMEADRIKLDKIQTRLSLLSSHLASTSSGDGRTYAEMQSHLSELATKHTALALAVREEKRSLEKTTEEFSSYRALYVKTIRATAAGELLGDLKTRRGRVFSETVIVRVTDFGLEIRHQNGTARVPATDLNTHTRDRFQWE